jgi:hypothetical protein
MLLTTGQEGFHIPHDGIKILPFMQPVSVKLRELIFPGQLPFCEHMFLQRMMRFNNHHRRGSFKTHPTLYADDRIAHMDIPTDAIRASQCLNKLNRSGGMVEGAVIDFAQLSLIKKQLYGFAAVFGHLGWPCFFRQHAQRLQRFLSSYRSSPEPFVD